MEKILPKSNTESRAKKLSICRDDLPAQLFVERPQIALVQLLDTAIQRNPAFTAALDVDVIEVALRVRFGAGHLRVAFDRRQVVQIVQDLFLDFAAQDHFAM